MIVLFGLIWMLSLVMIVVSLIKPKWGTFGKRPEWTRKKAALSWVAVTVISTGLMVASSPSSTGKQPQKQAAESQKYIFEKYYGFSADQSKTIENALSSIGISEIKDATKKKDHEYVLDVKAGAYTPDKDTIHVICDENNNLQTVTYGQIILWNEGKPVHQLSEYVLSSSEELEVTRLGKEMVTKALKSPSSAKFDSKTYKYFKIQGEITFIGKVDSQNSFGAMIRAPFKVKFRNKNGKMNPTYFMLENKQII